MLLGICTNMLPKEPNAVGFEYAETVKKIGYDYIELPLGQLNLLSDDDFREICRQLKLMDLPAYASNNFLTADIRLVGPELDYEKVRGFYKKALERAAMLEAQYVILGSPWSKKCPDGFPKSEAFKQLEKWCDEMGDCAKQYGITIALEPNNYTETNMIRTFQDTVDLAKACGNPNVRCLQDYFHLRMENDTVDSLLKYGKEYLVHSHFARIEKRGFPVDITEDSYYQTYFDALHEIGYEGGVTMEGFPVSKETFAKEAAATREFLAKYVK